MRRDIARLGFGQAHVRHYGARGYCLRILQPANHVRLGVRQNTADVRPVGDPPEWRPYDGTRALNAGNGVTGATAIGLDQGATSLRIAGRDRPPRLIRSAAGCQHDEHEEDRSAHGYNKRGAM